MHARAYVFVCLCLCLCLHRRQHPHTLKLAICCRHPAFKVVFGGFLVITVVIIAVFIYWLCVALRLFCMPLSALENDGGSTLGFKQRLVCGHCSIVCCCFSKAEFEWKHLLQTAPSCSGVRIVSFAAPLLQLPYVLHCCL